MIKWQKVKIGDLLTRYKEPIEVRDDVLYKRVTIRTKHKGVEIRDEEIGKKIGTKKQWLVKEGQFILSRIDARFGAMGMIPKEVDGAIVTNDFLAFDVNKNTIEQYLFYQLLKSPIFLEACKKASRGVTQRKRINEDFFLGYELTIPRHDAQKELCAKIELAEKGQETLKNQIENQKIYLRNLRKQILQDAIEGKLTKEWREKNPDIEPASELLKKIKKEKEKLISEKKIKKEKPLPEISKSEIPFELPESWVWTRLGEMCYRIHYGFNASAKKEKDGVRLLRITDIQDSKVDWDNVPGCDYSQKDIETYGLNENDIVIARTGGTIGKSFLVKNKIVESLFASYLIRLIPSKLSSSEYIKLFLETPIYWKQLFNAAWGAGQPNVNGSSLQKLFFPLPPLAEQLAIVSKLQTLMQKLDEVEKQIEKNLALSKQLSKAILAEAFNQNNLEKK